jgi:DNA-binding NtrC family response regulator
MKPEGTRILTSADGSTELGLPDVRLDVVEGPDRGTSRALDRLSIKIGNASDNDLALSDDTVSAHHAELAVDENGWRLRDAKSTNGTFVQGLRVIEAYLGPGAEIALGRTRLVFRSTAEENATRLRLSKRTNFGALLGHSVAMRAAFAMLEQAAKTNVTVLVIGESGTGKELAARGLHDESPRATGPFVVFDCGAASPTLVESQLFGHAKGAFTGATEARAGVFEAADGGTLVLDEIGELPLDLQPKLLRALESRTIQRLGETHARPVDVRFVACTNRNLEKEVAEGRFRQDLFFRLSVITVRLPSLRERREEIPRLVRHFLAKLTKDAADVPKSVLDVLVSYDWPGNVRELRNFAERFVALPGASPETLLAKSGPRAAEHDPNIGFHDAKQACLERFEREYLGMLFETYGDNIAQAARVAGLSRQSCYRLMHKYGFRVE